MTSFLWGRCHFSEASCEASHSSDNNFIFTSIGVRAKNEHEWTWKVSCFNLPFQAMSLTGHPVTIITLDEDEKLHLDEAALESVLNQPELRDRPVCLLPIAGFAFFVSKSVFRFSRCFSQGQVFSSQCSAPPSSCRGRRRGKMAKCTQLNWILTLARIGWKGAPKVFQRSEAAKGWHRWGLVFASFLAENPCESGSGSVSNGLV